MKAVRKVKKIKAISLFSGAGGMDVGFENVGVDVILANEIVKDASDTYLANHPYTEMVNDDIKNIMDNFYRFNDIDIVFGGPPCQGFSVAGKMNPNDERSKLIFTFLEAVNIIKPRMFVMENVKALGRLEKWKPVRTKFLAKANALGYRCEYYILNASEYGVPQKRERVFFIGIKDFEDEQFQEKIKKLLNKEKNSSKSIKETLKSLGKAGSEFNPNTCTAKITFATNPVMRKSPFAGMYFNGQGRPINVDEYSNTGLMSNK